MVDNEALDHKLRDRTRSRSRTYNTTDKLHEETLFSWSEHLLTFY